MCGHVGIAGKLGLKDEETMKRLLFFDFLRGPDATGLGAVRDNGDVLIAKLATDPITLFDFPRFKATLSGSSSRIFLGHNRAATTGQKNNFNAHPFLYGDILGAHNGTLDRLSWGRLEDAVNEKFNVDSQAMLAAINVIGIEETIKLCTTGSDGQTGAWSLVWYNLKEGSLNFLRNKHRPMWLCYEKNFERIFWASEWWMLEAAMNSRNLYELYREENTGYKYFPTEEDVHMKFDLGLILQGCTKLPEAKTQTLKGREPVAARTGDPFGRTGGTHGSVCGVHIPSHTGKKNSTTTSRGSKTPPTHIHWLGDVTSPFGEYITEEKFNQLAKYGCSWCERDIVFEEPGVTIFERDDLILCATCSGHNEVDDDTPSRVYASAGNFAQLL